jgi:hypothetical protein
MIVTAERLKRSTAYAVMVRVRRTGPAKRVGTIRPQSDGWAYNPIRTKLFGETFPTALACLESLRNHADEPPKYD